MLSRQYRQQKAAKILLRDFGFRAVPHFDAHNQILLCYDGPEDSANPAAVVSGPSRSRHPDTPNRLVWGCLAPWPLQGRILEALNGHA